MTLIDVVGIVKTLFDGTLVLAQLEQKVMMLKWRENDDTTYFLITIRSIFCYFNISMTFYSLPGWK